MAGAGESEQPEYVDSIINDNELVLGSFRNPDGVARIKSGERVEIERPVVTAVTDGRILFTTAAEDGSGAVSFDYEEVASVSVTETALALQTVEGVGIEWPLSASGSVPGSLRRHLRWVGELRSRVRSCGNDVELAAGEIRTLAEDLEWDAAEESYRQIRERLDELFNEVYSTEPITEDTLAPELTETERKLERAHARLFVARAESQLELARQLLENGDYEQGRKVLKRAGNYYERAKRKQDAIERGDTFQFGPQRSLTDDIKSLGWKLETAAAEPLRQAHEAKIKAEAADEDSEAVSHWERAFRRYGRVLTLEWGSNQRNFAGDPESVSADLEGAARRLIELHGALADDAWNEGANRQEAGDHKAALQSCLDAQKHLERAHELAAEFQPDRVEAIAPRLETMADEVMRMRHANTAEESDDATETEQRVGPEAAASTEEQSDSSDRQLPSASELAEMDTHHDITLDSEDLGVHSEDVLEADEDGTDAESDATQRRELDAEDGETTRH